MVIVPITSFDPTKYFTRSIIIIIIVVFIKNGNICV